MSLLSDLFGWDFGPKTAASAPNSPTVDQRIRELEIKYAEMIRKIDNLTMALAFLKGKPKAAQPFDQT